MGLLDQVIHVAENFQRGIVDQIFLEVAIAALHRAIARKVDDKIVAAHLSLAAGTFLQKISLVAHQEEPPLSISEQITGGEKSRAGSFGVIDKGERDVWQGLSQVPVDRAWF